MDTPKIHIKPLNGQRVRDPITGQLLPADGATKPRNSYWLRRMYDGSVGEIIATKKPAKPATDKPQESD